MNLRTRPKEPKPKPKRKRRSSRLVQISLTKDQVKWLWHRANLSDPLFKKGYEECGDGKLIRDYEEIMKKASTKSDFVVWERVDKVARKLDKEWRKNFD